MRWLNKQLRKLFSRQPSSHASPMCGVHCMDHPNTQKLVAAMQCLQKPFPAFWDPLPGRGHIETVWGTVLRKKPSVTYRREKVAAHDGGTISLDWHEPKEQKMPDDSPVLLLIAGLTGGSDQSYVRHATLAASARGYRVVVYNHCGVSGTAVTSPRLYCAMYTEDLREALQHISARHPAAPMHCCAWSIGANILVHFLAEEVERPSPGLTITAAATLANPFDLTLGDLNWRGPDAGIARRAYDHYLAGRMRSVFKANHKTLSLPVSGAQQPADTPPPHPPGKLQRWPTSVQPKAAASARTVRDFDAAATIHWFGFGDVDTYYTAASSARVLGQVATPLLCVQALDDPIAPAHAIPYAVFATNPNLILVTTPTGGHLGWVGGRGGLWGAPWTDKLILDYLDAARDLAANKITAVQGVEEEGVLHNPIPTAMDSTV